MPFSSPSSTTAISDFVLGGVVFSESKSFEGEVARGEIKPLSNLLNHPKVCLTEALLLSPSGLKLGCLV